ncbi:MAG: bacterioferritin-associated ferredoxin [Pseudomonadota bacterium]
MYVCLCRGITDKQVRDAAKSGHQSIEEMREALGIASQCGQCSGLVEELIANSVTAPSVPTEPLPRLPNDVQIWEEALV